MISRLKAEFHSHSKEDPNDNISYSAEELIDFMAAIGYDVLSITNHDVITYNDHLRDYAKEKGILLIPGVEATIENKHVLIINITDYTKGDIKTLKDLEKYKKEETLIVAPHPFYPESSCLWSKLKKNINLFDAIEYSHCYIKFINLNRKAVKVAREEKKPLLGTSDIHFKWQQGKTYSTLDAEKNVASVINAVKNNKIQIISSPLTAIEFLYLSYHITITLCKVFLNKFK